MGHLDRTGSHEARLDAHTKNQFEVIRTGAYIEGFPAYDPGTQALVADRIYDNILVIARDITVDRITMEVTTLAAGKSIRMGIYNIGTNLYPGTLLLDAGTVTTDTTGVKAITINQALTKGIYYLAFISNGTPSVRNARITWSPLGRQEHAFSANYKGGYYKAQAYGALPDSFPSAGTIIYNLSPIITVRVASLD